MHTNPAFHPLSAPLAGTARNERPGAAVPARGLADGKVKARAVLEAVPCSPEFDPDERRAYGGVMANVLADLAGRFIALRNARGIGPYVRTLARLSRKVEHALYIYTRIKEVMASLSEPEDIELEISRNGNIRLHPNAGPKPKDGLVRVSPSKDTTWAEFKRARGYDIRGTSLKWVETRVRSAKAKARKQARDAYIETHGLELGTSKQKPRDEPVSRQTGLIHPEDRVEPAPMILGEIWPPVPVPVTAPAVIVIVPVQLPRPDAYIVSLGRKVGLEPIYQSYSHDYDIMAEMWNGEVNIWQRAPP